MQRELPFDLYLMEVIFFYGDLYCLTIPDGDLTTPLGFGLAAALDRAPGMTLGPGLAWALLLAPGGGLGLGLANAFDRAAGGGLGFGFANAFDRAAGGGVASGGNGGGESAIASWVCG